MKSIIVFILFILLNTSTYSQYLVVSHPAYLYTEDSRHSAIIEKVSRGDTLILWDIHKKYQGYYKVKAKSFNRTAYIYQSKVRRYNDIYYNNHNTYAVKKEASTDIDWDIEIPAGYYDGIMHLTGNELKSKLNDIIQDHREYEYSSDTTDVWDILKDTDQDPNFPANVVLIYSGFSVNAAQEYNNQKGWEREHVWSQSHGEFGRTKNAGTDVHHIRPVLREFNGFNGKSNRDFDNGGEAFLYGDDLTGCFISDSTWEPRDEVKGDIARMMFYMAVRYEGENGEPDLELIYDSNTRDNFYHEPYYGNLTTLIEWHLSDPVDNWERRRNEIIYKKYQRNRNPFIDYPELVLKIWE